MKHSVPVSFDKLVVNLKDEPGKPKPINPLFFIINGYKFAFVNATRAEKNILTPGATETNSGVFRCYDSTDMENLIKEVKKNSDYVISIIHFGKEGTSCEGIPVMLF